MLLSFLSWLKEKVMPDLDCPGCGKPMDDHGKDCPLGGHAPDREDDARQESEGQEPKEKVSEDTVNVVSVQKEGGEGTTLLPPDEQANLKEGLAAAFQLVYEDIANLCLESFLDVRIEVKNLSTHRIASRWRVITMEIPVSEADKLDPFLGF